ncbi:hypothetical protein LPJ79_005408 [Coemansia sp. RSA 1821]|nr:hypothetical protein LPJ79_005408 [Coemansia sp. RSA 1821]
MCVNEYQHGDLIARRVHQAMQSFLTPYTSTGKCIESIRSLACISVFPECSTKTESFRENIPSYSKIIISVDDVSGRLLEMFKSEMHRQLPKQSATAIYADSQLSFEYWIDAGEQTAIAGATQTIAAAGDIMIFAAFLLAHLPPLPPRVTKTYRPNRKPLAEISKKTPELPIPPSSPLQRQLSRSKPVVSLADGFVLELETPSSGEYPALPPDEATNQPFRIAA